MMLRLEPLRQITDGRPVASRRSCEHARRKIQINILPGEALAISRETGIIYPEPIYLGVLACTTDDAPVFETALAKRDALLAVGAVSEPFF
ncbi:hypothetical protein CA601_31115 [Paraburkholderia hospita]|nr:hypothetical protein CA601_31115 [Paraburkholderia hospita]